MATKTITRMYDDYAVAEQVVRDLEAAGIPHDDISLVARDRRGAEDDTAATHRTDTADSNAGSGAGIGAVVGGGAGLLAGLGILAIPGVGPLVAAGWLATTLAGAVVGAGAGGIVGALTNAGVDERDAHVYAEGLRRGGALVTVRSDEANLSRAEDAMRAHRHVDPVARRAEYESVGWTGYHGDADTTGGARVVPARLRGSRRPVVPGEKEWPDVPT